MKFSTVIQNFREQGVFDIQQLRARVPNERSATLIQQLHRWAKKGLIIPVKRGFYALPDNMLPKPLAPEYVANQLYQPSYVTGLWRMNQLGLSPEGLYSVISATLGKSTEFTTPFGRYTYQHIEKKGFFGFETRMHRGKPTLVACSEKALLDFFWLKKIEWTETEIRRWRIEDPQKRISHEKLENMAIQWGLPRLRRAADNFITYLNSIVWIS